MLSSMKNTCDPMASQMGNTSGSGLNLWFLRYFSPQDPISRLIHGAAKCFPIRPAWVGPGGYTLDDPTQTLTGGSNQSGHEVGQITNYRNIALEFSARWYIWYLSNSPKFQLIYKEQHSLNTYQFD